jgi:predicted nucleotidyltransferase component of viral defense system
MPELSEFVAFVAAKSGIKKANLVEQEILIHRILREIHFSPHFTENYLFKGGSCLVKCYFGYYRFSVDLDFTWRNQEAWKVGEKELRRRLLDETKAFGRLLEVTSKQVGLDFMNEPKNGRYFEFGGGGRMVTFKMWKGTELLKIQVNFLEALLFHSKSLDVKTLLDGVTLSRDEEAYFEEFLGFYEPFKVDVYDEREILCEKVRAILTRKAQKLRDFYDIFMLDTHGFKVEQLTDDIVRKIKASLYYKKYRSNLEANKRATKFNTDVLEDPFERELFVESPPRSFEKFLVKLLDSLKDITSHV